MRGWFPFMLMVNIVVSTACGFNEGDDMVVEIDPNVAEELATAYVTEWQVQAGEELVLPLPEGFAYNFEVDWGDGNKALVTAHDSPAARHVYELGGTYVVKISGLLEAWSFWRISDSRDSIQKVLNLGDVGWKSLFGAFASCVNLTTVAGGNVIAVTDMGSMFDDAVLVLPETSDWDTGKVTDMSYMFAGAVSAQPQVENWDTRAVIDMRRMFAEAVVADPMVGNWNTASVLQMAGMFAGASAARPATGHWNTGAVIDMSGMFHNALLADPDVSCWNTAEVTDMRDMFHGAVTANPDVSCWDVSKVRDMGNMFRDAAKAVPDMSAWELAAVETMSGMFSGVALPASNWSALLVRAAKTAKQEGVVLDGDAHWDNTAATARAELIARGWVISDLGARPLSP